MKCWIIGAMCALSIGAASAQASIIYQLTGTVGGNYYWNSPPLGNGTYGVPPAPGYELEFTPSIPLNSKIEVIFSTSSPISATYDVIYKNVTEYGPGWVDDQVFDYQFTPVIAGGTSTAIFNTVYYSAYPAYQVVGYTFDEVVPLSAFGDPFTLTVEAVTYASDPEPSTWAFLLFGVGMAGLQLRRRRKTLVLQPAQ